MGSSEAVSLLPSAAVCDPARGVMVVEVKGGDVWCEGGEWRQRNRRTGHVQTIYPEAQASDTAYRIGPEVIEKVPEAEKLLYCHAVWFPDGAIDRSNLPMNLHWGRTDHSNRPKKI